MATTWNPADNVNITLSNYNLSAKNTSGSGIAVVRATNGANTGKKYFEATLSNTYGNTGVGFAASSFAMASRLGVDAAGLSIGYDWRNGNLWKAQAYTYVGGWTGGVYGFGIDLATGNVTLYHNGVQITTGSVAGNYATALTGLTVYPAFSSDSYPVCTAVFTNTQYLPSGFSEFGADIPTASLFLPPVLML